MKKQAQANMAKRNSGVVKDESHTGEIVDVVEDRGRKYVIPDAIAFHGQPLGDYHKNHNKQGYGLQTTLLKKFIKNLPNNRFFKKYTVVDVGNLTQPDAKFLVSIRDGYLARLDMSEKFQRDYEDALYENGMRTEPAVFEIGYFKKWWVGIMNILINISEADCFYAGRVFDFFMYIWEVGRTLHKQQGEDILDRMLNERRQSDLGTLARYANLKSPGPKAQALSYDFKNGEWGVQMQEAEV